MEEKTYKFKIFIDILNGNHVKRYYRQEGTFECNNKVLKDALFNMYETIVHNINLDYVDEDFTSFLIGIHRCQHNGIEVNKNYIHKVIRNDKTLSQYYWY